MLYHRAALRNERRQRRQQLHDRTAAAAGGKPLTDLYRQLTD